MTNLQTGDVLPLDHPALGCLVEHCLERLCRVVGHPIALRPIAHREEGADVAGARHFGAGLLLLEHPPQGLWSLHLVPQHPRIHPDVSGRALERAAPGVASIYSKASRVPACVIRHSVPSEEIECEQQGLRFDARRLTCFKSRQ